MGNNKPLKRHDVLKPLSHQHHFGLLFSWKLRKGFAKDISIDRLIAYTNWFFKTEIQPHFYKEEEYVFPILGNSHPLVKRALKEHRRIESLFKDHENPKNSLSLLEKELVAHIRFEERILFTEIQQAATREDFEKIKEIHFEADPKVDYPDPFWEKIK